MSCNYKKKLNGLICTVDWVLLLLLPSFQDKWVHHKDHHKKKKKATSVAMPAGMKTLHFCKIHFYLLLKMKLLCLCWIAIRQAYLQTNTIWKKVYDNLKQKESEGEFNVRKEWLDNFRGVWIFKCQDNRRNNFCWLKGSRQVPRCHLNNYWEKGYLLTGV